MAFTEILYDVKDKVATITMNRPDKLNAFTGVMMKEMCEAFDLSDADDDVRVVVVTGAGRGFCAGADLSSGGATFSRPDAGDGSAPADPDWSDPKYRDGGGILGLRIFESLKPVIGAINGPSVGIGSTMQLPMDIRIASEKAKFGFVFARRGIVPEACSSYFLPRVVGISQAVEWAYSGRVFDADEALKGGLVKEVVPHDDLLPRAYEIAQEIAQNTSPLSVTLIRHMMWRMLGANHPMEAHKIESRGVLATGRGPDATEGVMSFLEKRPANYKSKVSQDLPSYFPWWKDPEYS
jgi:enoyl-CoA hydratase/carnithine racemase